MNENEMDLSLSKMLVYGMGASIETPWGVIFFLSLVPHSFDTC